MTSRHHGGFGLRSKVPHFRLVMCHSCLGFHAHFHEGGMPGPHVPHSQLACRSRRARIRLKTSWTTWRATRKARGKGCGGLFMSFLKQVFYGSVVLALPKSLYVSMACVVSMADAPVKAQPHCPAHLRSTCVCVAEMRPFLARASIKRRWASFVPCISGIKFGSVLE